MPTIAPNRSKVPKIVWQPALAPPTGETWPYADNVARNGTWAITQTLMTGSLAGGFLGANLTVSGRWAGGLGGSGGRLYVERTFTVPPGTYTVAVPVAGVDYASGSGVFEMGMDLSGDGPGGGSHLLAVDGVDGTLSGTASCTSTLTIRLGILDAEYDVGVINSAIIFGSIVISGVAIATPLALEFGYPMRAVRSWTQPSPGSERVRFPSGAQAAWIDEHESLLDGVAIHIPAETSASVFAPQTGWNGASGWQAFLRWARRGNSFAFYPNRLTGTNIICQLADPLPVPAAELAAQREVPLRLRSTTLARFTGY